MFDISCGGIIPAKMNGVDFVAAPYLARQYACTHCKSYNKVYAWSADYTFTDLDESLQSLFPDLKGLKEIRIVKRDMAGIVESMQLKAQTGHYTLPGKKLYSILKSKIKSFCFSVAKNEKGIVFKGRGYGHHLGLCQWGARQMVVKGHDYKSVLSFYYPGIEFAVLNEIEHQA